MKDENNAKRRKRQYVLPLPLVEEVEIYCLRNSKRKSEVVEMALKKFLKENQKALALAGLLILVASQNLFAQFGEVSTLWTKIKGVVTPIGYLVGGGGLVYGIIMFAWKNADDHEEAIQHLKGGVIAGFAGFAVVAIAELLISKLM